MRTSLQFTSLVWLTLLASSTARGSSLLPDSAAKEFQRKLARSEIHLNESWQNGKVRQVGAVLVLLEDGVPAKAFHTLAQQKPYPRVWHLDDYARLEIVNGKASSAEPSPSKAFTHLSRGELLVVLNHKFKGDAIELWTHTLNPVEPAAGDGKQSRQHASTKLVFRFPPEVLASGDVAAILAEMKQWFRVFESESEAREFAEAVRSEQTPSTGRAF